MKKNLFYLTILVFASLAACSKDKGDDGVAVEGVSISKSAMSIYVGQKDTLQATVSPDNATNKTVTFISSNTSVATVDNNGIITAIASGTTAITASANNGTSTTCNVTVSMMQMKIVTKVSAIDIGLAGSGTATVDWGDGSSNTYTLGAEDTDCMHTFQSVADNHTITVEGANVSYLNVGVQVITSVDLRKNPALVHFECWNNQIAELDFSYNTALKFVDCKYNRLSANGIDAMFQTLHSNNSVSVQKEIRIKGNSGVDDCNRSIAVNKGWRVSDQ